MGLSSSGAASYKSDNLWNYEIGAKTEIGKLLLTAAAFQMKWTDIQQSVLIPICYLPRTLNVGEARVRGGEFQLAGTVWPGLQANLGVGYQDPVLLTGGVSLPPGSRILDVPSITGSVAVTYTRPLSATLDGFVSSDFSYTGNSTSETSGFPLQRGGYGLLNARFGVHWDRYEVELYTKNLTSREPNMGDVYLESVNQLDSNANVVPFVAIPPPRQVGLQFSRSF